MILAIGLFFLGVVFLLLGWRWQNPPSDEVLNALKGFSHVKKELRRIQDQIDVHVLEDKLQRTNLMELKDAELEGVEQRESNLQDVEQKENGKLYSLSIKEPRRKHKDLPHQQHGLPPQYQEVLSLAANGQGVPEIAQRLLLSQDAVRMVLKTQSQGGAQ